MKHLVIYAHPNPQSFNNAIKDTVLNVLKEAGKDVVLRNLYDLNFNPVLTCDDFLKIQQCAYAPDVLREQTFVKEAGVIIFIYPLWWAGMPAIMKGYIDRVFSYGFAYEITETGARGLLASKKALLITTTGATREMYEESGMYDAMARTTDAAVCGFTGMELLGHKYFPAVPYVTDEVRKEMIEELKAFVREKLS
jgi:NAD(P)H dehydrogenase (quinone)